MKQKLFLVLFLVLSPFGAIWAQNEMFKALFMYNFTKMIEWPAGSQQGDFVIGVLGDSPIIPELNKLADTKKVGNQKIVIKKFDDVDAIDKCAILFLPSGKSNDFSNVLSKVQGKPILFITDKEGLAQKGACINYITVGGKLNFEINKSKFQSQNLQMANSLAELGVSI